AVLMDRSARLIAALIGIMKAGAAYVPVDPSYPSARATFLVEDSGAVALLTDRRLASAVPHRQTIVLDDVWELIASMFPQPLPAPAPSCLAYVIYTSGSTGQPKGCQIEHRNLAQYLTWAARTYFERDDEGTFALYSSL